jgi:hypothetical protein
MGGLRIHRGLIEMLEKESDGCGLLSFFDLDKLYIDGTPIELAMPITME